MIALFWCMESPRYYMQPGTPHRSPARAYEILLRARQTQVSIKDCHCLGTLYMSECFAGSDFANNPNPNKLQALRDLYLLHKSVELDALHVTKNGNEIEFRERTLENGLRLGRTRSHGQVLTSSFENMQLTSAKDGLTYASILSSGLYRSVVQYRDLWTKPKLKNAMLSTCVVALAQQLCGSKFNHDLGLHQETRHLCSEANYKVNNSQRLRILF